MYAVVNIGGKQAKVEEGTLVAVEKLDAEVGETVTLPVIMIVDGDTVCATPSEIAAASVTAEVIEHFKGEKSIIFKFKKRKGYKRTKGHRQNLTAVKILSVSLDGSAPKKAAVKAEKPKAAEKAVEAPVAETVAIEVPVVEAPVAEIAAADAAATCAAKKSDGSQCTNKPKEGSLYCGVHAKKYEG